MNEPLINWNEILHKRGLLDNRKRYIVSTAIAHFPRADKEIRDFAVAVLASQLNLPVDSPQKELIKAIQDRQEKIRYELPHKQGIAFVIMALWANARQQAIEMMRKEIHDRKIAFFVPNWTFVDGANGCPSSSPLDQLLEKNSSRRAILAKLSKLKSRNLFTEDDFDLALLWLSSRLVNIPSSSELSSFHSFTRIQTSRAKAEKHNNENESNLEGDSNSFVQSTDQLDIAIDNSSAQAMNTENMEHIPVNVIDDTQIDISDTSDTISSLEAIHAQGNESENQQIPSFITLRAAIENSVQNALEVQRVLSINLLQNLQIKITAGELAELKDQFKSVQEAIGSLWGEFAELRNNCIQYISILDEEFEKRPELALLLPQSADVDTNTLNDLKNLATAILNEHTRLEAYDSQRSSKQVSYTKSLSKLLEVEDTYRAWLGSATNDVLNSAPAIHEPTLNSFLSEFDLAIKSVGARQLYIENHIARAKEAALRQIDDALKNLETLQVQADTIVSDRLVLGDLKLDVLSTLSPATLYEVRDSLSQLIAEWQLRNQSTPIQRLAASLIQSWDESQWYELTVNLSKEGSNLELLLLLFASSHAENVAQSKKLTHELIESVESAMVQIVGEQGIPRIWNYSLPLLLTNWQPSDVMAKMKLGIAAIAAHYLSEPKLPVSWGWEITYEWPVADMPAWKTLWQAFLLETSFMFSKDNAIAETQSDLEDALQQIRNVFIQENGQYVRARQLKHGRIVRVLNQRFMPEVEAYLTKFLELEQSIRTTPADQYSAMLTQVLGYCAEIVTLDESFLEAKFDVMLEEEQVWEPEGFHRRTLSNVFTSISQSLSHYADVFKSFAMEHLKDANAIDPRRLQKELSLYFAPSSIEHQMLELLISQSPITSCSTEFSVEQLIEHACLNQQSFVMRCPRTVASLLHESVRLSTELWRKLHHSLIEDLANPSDSIEAVAASLLSMGATQQLLLLDGQLSRNLYEDAVRKSDHYERKSNELYKELIEMGGDFLEFTTYRSEGRWNLLEREIGQRISVLNATREKENRDREDHLRDLNKKLSELDNQIFEMRQSIPHEGNEMLGEAFAKAKRALRSIQGVPNDVVGAVEGFYNEVNYQYQHNSWVLSKIHDIASRLNQGFTKESKNVTSSRTTRHILDLFERNELMTLGLSGRTFESSKKSTRETLLTNFIGLKDIKTIAPDSLDKVQLHRIHTLFQNFARMVVMKPVRDMSGEPVINREDLFWSVYELQNPKTPFLETHCILTILPGSPIKASSVENLETVIDEKELLTDRFMILFSPGCSQQIKSRLEMRYPHGGIVIIDDATMSELVLAEADLRRPVGYLRSLLLNAKGATEVDIFTVNQLVTPRSSIFVGRERWIDKLVKSSENFALYGGRRIGKSSILKVVEEKLLEQGSILTKLVSCEGNGDYQDNAFARTLARDLRLHREVNSVEDFAICIEEYLERHPTNKVVLLIDEIDKYINCNRTTGRHLLIEAFRKLSDHHGERFRVVFAGFVDLNACLRGRGPYTPSSDPWRRMIKDEGPLENLDAAQAEEIVNEGFREILGWKYASAVIPQLIVEYTGGHPAFVQQFCDKLQKRVARRGDRTIRVEDLNAIFDDSGDHSFIHHVKETLGLNLNAMARFLILSIVSQEGAIRRFTREKIKEYIMLVDDGVVPITEEHLDESLERLKVTSVIREIRRQVFEFTVPDYPSILNRLGEIEQLDNLAKQVRDNPNDDK